MRSLELSIGWVTVRKEILMETAGAYINHGPVYDRRTLTEPHTHSCHPIIDLAHAGNLQLILRYGGLMMHIASI